MRCTHFLSLSFPWTMSLVKSSVVACVRSCSLSLADVGVGVAWDDTVCQVVGPVIARKLGLPTVLQVSLNTTYKKNSNKGLHFWIMCKK